MAMIKYSEMVHSSIRDILSVVFRHRGKMLLCFCTIVVLVTMLTFIAPEVYRSDAHILIRSGRENLTVDLSQNERAMTMVHDRQSQESLVNSEVDILKSRFLLGKVVEKIGVDAYLTQKYPAERSASDSVHMLEPLRSLARSVKSAFYKTLIAVDLATEIEPNEKAILKLTESLKVEPVEKSNVIQATMECENRRLAKDTLNLLVELYLQRHIEVNAAQASPEFFEEQSAQKSRELEKVEDELDAFRKEHGIASLPQQQETILLQIKDKENQRDSAAASTESSRARVAKLEEAVKGRSDTIQLSKITGRHNYSLDAMKEKLLELKVEETNLATRYTDSYLPLVEAREKVQKAEIMVNNEEPTHTEITMGLDLNYQSLMLDLETERTRYEANKAEFEVLAREVTGLHDQLKDLSDQQIKLESLERKRQMATLEYTQYRDNLHRARISSELDKIKVSNASLIQPATEPLEPIRPKKLLIIAVGIVFGFLFALGLAYISEYFDDTFRTDADVERWLELPVLASVSEEEFRGCT